MPICSDSSEDGPLNWTSGCSEKILILLSAQGQRLKTQRLKTLNPRQTEGFSFKLYPKLDPEQPWPLLPVLRIRRDMGGPGTVELG